MDSFNPFNGFAQRTFCVYFFACNSWLDLTVFVVVAEFVSNDICLRSSFFSNNGTAADAQRMDIANDTKASNNSISHCE